MSRWARRADANQPEIVKALREVGVKVVPTHTVGQGMPDLITDYDGFTALLECKDPSKPKGDRKLTPAQQEFHSSWTGPIFVVETAAEAITCATMGYERWRAQRTLT